MVKTEDAIRLPDSVTGEFPKGFDTRVLSYWRREGVWYLWLPRGGLGTLKNHEVVEDEDGTITVSPSIKVSNPKKDQHRHGFLKRGVWVSCPDDQ